jgi:hypothetical protein
MAHHDKGNLTHIAEVAKVLCGQITELITSPVKGDGIDKILESDGTFMAE